MGPTKLRIPALACTTCLLLSGCEGRWPFGDPDDSPAANTAPVARVAVSSLCVTTGDLIAVDASASTDHENQGELEYAMDRDGDGLVDTPWFTTPVLEFRQDAGDWFAFLVVRDPGGLEGRTEVLLLVEPDLRDLVITPSIDVMRWENGNGIDGNVTVLWELTLVASDPPRLDTVDPVRCWVLDGASGDTLLAGTPGFVEVVPPGNGSWVHSNGSFRVSGILTTAAAPLEEWPCLAPVRFGMELRGGQCGQVLHLEWGSLLVDCDP